MRVSMSSSPPGASREALVETAAGRLHYLERGEGRPVVLLHTVGTSAHLYAGAIERLSATCRAIALDLPGHGDSCPLASHPSMADFADAVAGFSLALSLEEPVFVGVSIGGPICVELACRAPSQLRVAGIVVSECTAMPEEMWAVTWPFVERNFAIPTQSREEVATRFRELDDELFWRWNVDRNKAGGWAMVQSMRALRDYDILAAARRASAPALLLYGADGPFTASDGPAALAEALGCGKTVIEGAGHFPMIDSPDEFSRRIAEFVDGLGAN